MVRSAFFSFLSLPSSLLRLGRCVDSLVKGVSVWKGLPSVLEVEQRKFKGDS